MTTLVGLVAAAVTAGAWLPQIWRTWRTRSADDLSWGYLAGTALGMSLWLSYGLLARDAVVITANVATVTFLLTLVALKARSRRRGVVAPPAEEVLLPVP